MQETLKVALIGAASPQWGFLLLRDLIVSLSGGGFTDSCVPVLVLEDIDARNLEKQVQLARRVVEKTGNRVRVESTGDQSGAIEGARFVIASFAQGSRPSTFLVTSVFSVVYEHLQLSKDPS